MAAGRAVGLAVAEVGCFGGDKVILGDSAAALAELSTLYRGAFAKAVG